MQFWHHMTTHKNSVGEQTHFIQGYTDSTALITEILVWLALSPAIDHAETIQQVNDIGIRRIYRYETLDTGIQWEIEHYQLIADNEQYEPGTNYMHCKMTFDNVTVLLLWSINTHHRAFNNPGICERFTSALPVFKALLEGVNHE